MLYLDSRGSPDFLKMTRCTMAGCSVSTSFSHGLVNDSAAAAELEGGMNPGSHWEEKEVEWLAFSSV